MDSLDYKRGGVYGVVKYPEYLLVTSGGLELSRRYRGLIEWSEWTIVMELRSTEGVHLTYVYIA